MMLKLFGYIVFKVSNDNNASEFELMSFKYC